MRLNKKGFTLVELLAVIVVLAIIALIGYSAVGGIIENAQYGANARSAESFANSMVQQCLLKKTADTTFDPTTEANATAIISAVMTNTKNDEPSTTPKGVANMFDKDCEWGTAKLNNLKYNKDKSTCSPNADGSWKCQASA